MIVLFLVFWVVSGRLTDGTTQLACRRCFLPCHTRQLTRRASFSIVSFPRASLRLSSVVPFVGRRRLRTAWCIARTCR